MVWALVILIIFVCVFLLIARVYVGKDKQLKETSDSVNEEAGEEGEAGADE